MTTLDPDPPSVFFVQRAAWRRWRRVGMMDVQGCVDGAQRVDQLISSKIIQKGGFFVSTS